MGSARGRPVARSWLAGGLPSYRSRTVCLEQRNVVRSSEHRRAGLRWRVEIGRGGAFRSLRQILTVRDQRRARARSDASHLITGTQSRRLRLEWWSEVQKGKMAWQLTSGRGQIFVVLRHQFALCCRRFSPDYRANMCQLVTGTREFSRHHACFHFIVVQVYHSR
jgi:hypothetical protein